MWTLYRWNHSFWYFWFREICWSTVYLFGFMAGVVIEVFYAILLKRSTSKTNPVSLPATLNAFVRPMIRPFVHRWDCFRKKDLCLIYHAAIRQMWLQNFFHRPLKNAMVQIVCRMPHNKKTWQNHWCAQAWINNKPHCLCFCHWLDSFLTIFSVKAIPALANKKNVGTNITEVSHFYIASDSRAAGATS